MKDLLIVGAGGFGAEAAWVAEDMNAAGLSPPWNILGYIDDNPAKTGVQSYAYRVLGSPEQVGDSLGHEKIWYFCAIGDNAARRRMAARLSALGWRTATLIHPSAVRAKNAVIGEGTYIGALSIVSPNCTIGRHVIVNQRASIGHDAWIGDFCNICPGGQVNGFCRLERGSLLGSNASLYQGVSVGENAVVGANSLAIRNVAPDTSVLGVPAREIPVLRRLDPQAEQCSNSSLRKIA
jgi:sugar O-acyltransferase (sialic acid O-acetyltransferase NeuD family)